MPDLSDLEVGQENLILFKGRPTTGKTRAIFAFPKPIMIYDLDGKVETIVKEFKGQFKPGEIFYEKFGPTDYERLDAMMERDINENKFRTIVIDSLTTLSAMILKYMIKIRGGNPAARGKSKGAIDFNIMEDFGGENDAILDVINFLIGKSNPTCYRILTAHLIPIETKDQSGRVIATSWELLTGGKKIAAKIPGRFKEIWHFNQGRAMNGSTSYEVIFKSDGIDFANTMLPLPAKVDVTGKNLFELVRELCKEQGVILPT